MNQHTSNTVLAASIVALGGFLMGFDASVISGAVKFIELEFDLSKIQLGWSVASLAFAATFAMMVAGPLSDRFGRKPVLKVAAILFLISAVISALAPSFLILIIARMIGGLGVGAALIVAPMYIAEISPPQLRGRMVSINQLAQLVMDIAGKKLTINNIPGPLGVRGRNSDNQLIAEKLSWSPSRPLLEGLEKTYHWIEQQNCGLHKVTRIVPI